MAKIQKSITFDKAQINKEDRTITEYLKDEVNVYKIDDILTDWNMIEGITFTIKQVDKLSGTEDVKESGEDE